jgi:predicted nucleic acid-binding protein
VKAVADTGPLNYLVLIEEIGVLEELCQAVVVPDAVFQELTSPDAPPAVRAWARACPPWLEVQEVTRDAPPLPDLHPGEREVIRLALEIGADAVLIDERDGRREAEALSLPIVGTLGILNWAARQGLIDLPAAVERLQQTNFRASSDLFQLLLERVRQGGG